MLVGAGLALLMAACERVAAPGGSDTTGAASPAATRPPAPPAPEVANTATAAAPADNLLINAGFESGREGWFWMEQSKQWRGFDIATSVARSGRASGRLLMQSDSRSTDIRIHGMVQEVRPARFPARAQGWYRVDEWVRPVPRQYVQLVVIVWGGHAKYPNYQLRYVLAGTRVPPFKMANAQFIIPADVSVEPPIGKWIRFEVPLLEDFRKHWGMTPAGFEKIHIFMEVRHDDRPPSGQVAQADVYFDDLYIGP